MRGDIKMSFKSTMNLIKVALEKSGATDVEMDEEISSEVYAHFKWTDGYHYWICWNLPDDDDLMDYEPGYVMEKIAFEDERSYPDEPERDDIDIVVTL